MPDLALNRFTTQSEAILRDTSSAPGRTLPTVSPATSAKTLLAETLDNVAAITPHA